MAKIFFKNNAKQYDTWNGLTFSFSENNNGRLEFKIDNPNQQIILEMDKSEFESEVRQVNKAIQVQARVSPTEPTQEQKHKNFIDYLNKNIEVADINSLMILSEVKARFYELVATKP